MSKDPQAQAETKHTPGPWHLSNFNRYVRHRLANGIKPNICDMEVFGGPPEERDANAQLIVAAPDLLKTLKAVVHRLERIDGFGCPQSLIDEMREVIEKAEKQP